MPKTVIANQDDIILLRDKWAELVALFLELKWTRDEAVAVIEVWAAEYVERKAE